MNMHFSEKTLWKALFFGLILGYCLYYAPYGVNETDGGFITGLAWQLLQGKVLYLDIVYVRPPLPVWLRALELGCLPEHFGVLGERCIFYLKMGAYSCLAAALLASENRRWLVATFGFVVSAHCYPAMAWHTVDGIFFSVLAVYLFFGQKSGWKGYVHLFLGGMSLFAAMLCKQSFYPVLFIVGGVAFFLHWRRAILFFTGFSISMALFVLYLRSNNILENFLLMTNGAAAGGQALQHGIVDYFRVTPELALPSIGMLGLGVWFYRRNPTSQWPLQLWLGWIIALVLSYVAVTCARQEHTVPFAQARALFWVAVVFLGCQIRQARAEKNFRKTEQTLVAIVLLGISWSASISWGYNLPVLFATPMVWAVIQVFDALRSKSGVMSTVLPWVMVTVLLLAFRVGHEFVYRDGRRGEMTESLGEVFPKLSGIVSSRESRALYLDLKLLVEKFGPDFTVLPAFPQANYLTGTKPQLPLDWVVNRETNGNNNLIYKEIKKQKPVFFVQKEYLEKIQSDPELSVTKEVVETADKLAETAYFVVIQATKK